jgi:predicted dehydrogenase
MKIGVVGLGSMGRRRVRDLRHFGHEVIGVDIRSDRRADAEADFQITTFECHTKLPSIVDAVVISTPPDRHAYFYDYCYQENLSFFSEANIFTPSPAWFAAREETSTAKSYPSASWLFHPLVRDLRDKIGEIGASEINTATHRYGGFLPDWHGWEPYHEFYAGRKNTSATREMVPFEAEILVHALGPVSAVSALAGQTREWHNDIADSMFLALEFVSGAIGTLTVELHQVTPIRETRIAMLNDTLLLQLGEGKFEHFSRLEQNVKIERPRSYRNRWGFYFEDIYREEIRAWVDALNGAPYPKTWSDDRHLSDILYAAELSTAEGRKVAVSEIANVYDGVSWIDAENGMPLNSPRTEVGPN